METHVRTLAKTVTYRIVGIMVTTGIAWALTHQIMASFGIGLADLVVKLGVYYFHERLWSRVSFGRPRLPEYTI